MPKKELPKLSRDELLARAFRIKPMKADEKGRPHFIKPCDLETTAFTWDPELMEAAKGLTEIDTIVTYHSYGAPSFFKPDISEVLAQIPKELAGKVTAFMTDTDDAQPFAEGGSYHRGITRLFTGVLPESVKGYPVVYKGKAIYPEKEPPKPIKVMHPIKLKPN
jgi:hypothetical protein